MANSKSRGQQRDKPFRDALRIEAKLAEEGEQTPALPGSLRFIARSLLVRAGEDTQAAREVGDRLDGKPAQEAAVTIEDSRYVARVPEKAKTTEQWQQQHSQPMTH